MRSKYFFVLKVICFLFYIMNNLTASQEKTEALVFSSHAVIKDFNSSFDWELPEKLLHRCKAVGIFPGIRKAGFFAGFHYGEGIILKKDEQSSFSPPAFFKLKGISLGLQAGYQEADLVMFIMDDLIIKELENGKTGTIDLSLATAAGPAGREWLKSRKKRIFAYAHTKGLYAGINISGFSLKYNYSATRSYYQDAFNVQMIFDNQEIQKTPSSASGLIMTLKNLYSGDFVNDN